MTNSATPTRADVLREFWDAIGPGKCHCAECMSELLVDEVLRLRAHRDAMIRRVEALPAMALATAYGAHRVSDAISRAAVLAALREGGET